MIENQYFLDHLISEKLLSEDELEFLQDMHQDNAYELLLHLVSDGKINRNKLGRLWGDSIKVAYTNLDKTFIQPDVVIKLSGEFARKNKVIALYQFGSTITLATTNPKSVFNMNKIEKILDCQVSPVFSFPDEIDKAIDKYYKATQPIITVASDGNQGSVISEATKEILVNNAKEIQNAVYLGGLPSMATVNSTRNTLLDEVHKKLNISTCLHQLRISDEYTYSHSINVAMLSAAIGKLMEFSEKDLKELTLGALLHDIGKMKIPKVILNKPHKLTPEETKLVQKHPHLGYQLALKMEISQKATDIIYSHHEKIDGSGYPRGLQREEISLNAQIVSLADIYDALVSDRPYKKGLSHHETLNIMLLEGQFVYDFNLLYKFIQFVYKNDYTRLKTAFVQLVKGEVAF